jgi:DNA-binding response OmpR family regulator
MAAEQSESKLRVLYCEDDPDTREIMCILLGTEGFEVVCPDNPADCVRLAKEQKFDAYVLDKIVPELSGVGLCEQIREFDTQTPVIFFSGAAYESDKDEALAAGAQAYIVKPAEIEQVIETIRSSIRATKMVSRKAAD